MEVVHKRREIKKIVRPHHAFSRSEICTDFTEGLCLSQLRLLFLKILPLIGWLKQQACLSHSSGGWEVQDQGTRKPGVPLPGL